MGAALELSKIEKVIAMNDLSALSESERHSYYREVCNSLGLNPLTQPFGYIKFPQGGLKLYANKGCAEQLRRIYNISITEIKRAIINDVMVVTVCVEDGDKRVDEDVGAVDIKGLTGDKLANAIMKAITKAKRRATLSICGLGMLDESEIETVEGASTIPVEHCQPERKQLPDSQPAKQPTKKERAQTPVKDAEDLRNRIDDADNYLAEEYGYTREQLWNDVDAYLMANDLAQNFESLKAVELQQVWQWVQNRARELKDQKEAANI